jgi:hypothetical protein
VTAFPSNSRTGAKSGAAYSGETAIARRRQTRLLLALWFWGKFMGFYRSPQGGCFSLRRVEETILGYKAIGNAIRVGIQKYLMIVGH